MSVTEKHLICDAKTEKVTSNGSRVSAAGPQGGEARAGIGWVEVSQA